MSKRVPRSRREVADAPAEPAGIHLAQSDVAQVESPERAAGSMPWLLVLLAGSGCAALIYEIVWFQLLQLVIGSSAVSLALLLAAYMGGLCLGSAALPRVVSAGKHPLRVYAFLEVGIGVFGILALVGVPVVGRIYLAGSAWGLAGLVLRGVVAAACLLPPTLLMGGSLPAAVRWVGTTPEGVPRMGYLYSANIAGAVIGCLAAGFYLLRVGNVTIATLVAAVINCAVALAAWALAKQSPHEEDREEPTERPGPLQRAPGAWMIYGAIALSGMSALGAEVVWTRLLSLLLGATVYTFSIILAVFLVGLWAGSSAGSFLARRILAASGDPRRALSLCQVLLAAAIAWTAFTLAYVLPYWPVDPQLSISPWFNFDLDIFRCVHAILPATLLWGASFPLALAAAAAKDEDPGRLTGEIYAANTAGSIVGALLFSLVLIPSIGTRGAQQVLIWLAEAAALAALVAAGWSIFRRPGALALLGSIAGAAALAFTVSDVPWQAIAYGRRVAPILRDLKVSGAQTQGPLFLGEGMNSSVVITERGEQRFFYVSGKSEASSAPIDMRLQRMMGHLPALVHRAPRSVLVVGFGAGVTAGSFVPYPEVQSIRICELEPIIPPASNEYFGKQNYRVLDDRRTSVVYDDARHYIYTAPDKFDVITTDPIHPWVKGTSALYSRDYFELVKSHLNPGGVAAQWLPLYESDEETVKSELATFFSVFPNGTVWSNFQNGDGYDLVLLGSTETSPIDADAIQRRLEQAGYSGVAASLADTGFHSAAELLATYTGRASDLEPLLAGAPITDDRNMRLQYLAGLGLNTAASDQIYRDILAYRKFPEGLLTGSGERMENLREVLGRTHRTF